MKQEQINLLNNWIRTSTQLKECGAIIQNDLELLKQNKKITNKQIVSLSKDFDERTSILLNKFSLLTLQVHNFLLDSTKEEKDITVKK